MDNLVAIAEAAGVTLDWLATGREPMRPGAADAPAEAPVAQEPRTVEVPVDEELMAELVAGIIETYRFTATTLDPREIGRIAERMRGDLVEAFDDPGIRRRALKPLLNQLARQLQEMEPAHDNELAPPFRNAGPG